MPYDMLTRGEKKWIEKHVTGSIARGIRGIPKIERCKGGSGYKLFEAYGINALGCMDQAINAYFPNDEIPVKICRYNVKSEAGGWYMEYLESTDTISLKDTYPEGKSLRVLETAMGTRFKNSYEVFVSDIRGTGYVGGEYVYAPRGLYLETFDVPDPEDDGDPSMRRRTKHIRAYIVHPDFDIEKIIDRKNWAFRQFHIAREAEREELVRSRIGIGDPWANKPSVREKFCKDCLDIYYRLSGKQLRCPTNYRPWMLECDQVKWYLGQKKR